MSKILNTVHWKKYLDVTNGNPQVGRFLESRGNDVLWQVAQNVHKSGRGGKHKKNQLVMVIHENAPNAILIEKKDYMEVLELCLRWFENRENYEKCAEILKFKNDINHTISSSTNLITSDKKQPKLI